MLMNFTTLVKPPKKVFQACFTMLWEACGAFQGWHGGSLLCCVQFCVCPMLLLTTPCDVPAMDFFHRRICELLEHQGSIQA